MDILEAEELASIIDTDLGPNRATVRKLGNNEHVVLLSQKGGLEYWLWQESDLAEYLIAKCCGVCSKETAHVKPCRACNRATCATCRRIVNGVVCVECLGVESTGRVA